MMSTLRRILPEWIKRPLRFIKIKLIHLIEYPIIHTQPARHRKALEKLRKKGHVKVKVAFFLTHSSVWKYEGVYRLMEQDPRFEPIVIVCPVVNYGRKNMLMEMEKAFKMFVEQGYNVIRAYDENNDSYLDVKKEIAPDIIFYTNPYKGLIDDRYYITRFKDILTCYVNYSYSVSINEKAIYDTILANTVWRFFLENDIIYQGFCNQSRNKAYNGIVSGYPGVEDLEYETRNDGHIWKLRGKEIKRIIWAPHHTIEEKETLNYSNFLDFSETMLKIAEQRKDQIQISFKPHPLLKVKLYNHKNWGKEKTDFYYKKWATGENTQLDTDLYIDLFNSSDALIHDCGSFIAEYLHCGKPALFIFNKKSKEQFNEFGQLALNQHYHAVNEYQITEFIDNVVCGGNDVKKDSRKMFYNTYLSPPNNKKPSENIFFYLCDFLWGHKNQVEKL